MSRSDADYLRHIADEAAYLAKESENTTWDQFRSDETLRRAFIRSIEIMGEATKQLSDDLRDRHSEIDRRGMAGMRDRLIHARVDILTCSPGR